MSPTVEAHFGKMKKLGANVVRVHLQLGKFMDGQDKASEKALDRLAKLLRLAENERLYLDLSGLGWYHKKGAVLSIVYWGVILAGLFRSPVKGEEATTNTC